MLAGFFPNCATRDEPSNRFDLVLLDAFDAFARVERLAPFERDEGVSGFLVFLD